jgi:PAT family beta-lactamase induction signal transducer AmpG
MSDNTIDTRPVSPREILILLMLGLLYLVQGLPFGFQAEVLPVYLRARGESFTTIALTHLLALPWMFKVFVGPFMDSFESKRFGRRKAFILPLQLALFGTMVLAACTPIDRSFALLYVLILVMNVFAATMDVAVDGLAIGTLRPRTITIGNVMQVDGYRLGMIVSGGILYHSVHVLGFRGMFAVAAVITLVVHIMTWWFPEREHTSEAREAPDVRGAIRSAWEVVSGKNGRALVLFVLMYKAGEAIADMLFKPMLVDRGMSEADIALYVNTLGEVTSMVGPIVAGLLARFMGIQRAIVLVIALRVLPLGGELMVALGMRSHELIVGVTLFEHLIGSALTTLTFAMMMTVVDLRSAGTQFTVFATAELIGKGLLGFAAGPLGDHLGLVGTYTIALAFTVAFAIVGPGLARRALATAPA